MCLDGGRSLFQKTDKSGFVRETLDMIGKVDREGWAVLVAEKKP